MNIKKAVVIATESGQGSIPTEMMPLIDKPIIQYVIDEISEAGIKEVLIVLGENSDSLMKLFEKSGQYDPKTSSVSINKATVYFSKQAAGQDYASAILSARRFVGEEPFALLNGTEIFTNQVEPAIKQVLNAYRYLRHSVVGLQKNGTTKEVVEAKIDDEDFYSIQSVHLNNTHVPKDKALYLCGRAVFRPEIFSYLEYYQNKDCGRSGFIEAVDKMLKDQKVYGIAIPGEKYDLSTQAGYIKSIIDLALDHNDFKEEIEKHIGERMNVTLSECV
jgi:UTP--glucose-1-phosphate uridylyltransferase